MGLKNFDEVPTEDLNAAVKVAGEAFIEGISALLADHAKRARRKLGQ